MVNTDVGLSSQEWGMGWPPELGVLLLAGFTSRDLSERDLRKRDLSFIKPFGVHEARFVCSGQKTACEGQSSSSAM